MATRSQTPKLERLLKKAKFPARPPAREEKRALQALQLKLLRIQQGVWHQRKRVVVVFEGFDAAGKGGAIRHLVERLDPRGVRVVAVGPPTKVELGRHFLARFWRDLPDSGMITVFDRSWYGRVLVERVEKLAPAGRIKEAYAEIREFERMLVNDGVFVIKIFLAISFDEQLHRFEDRLKDPYKQWKLSNDDLRARAHWGDYVRAVDKMFVETHRSDLPWILIPANDKHYARLAALDAVTSRLKRVGEWIESKAARHEKKSLQAALKELGV